jgi:hypothetical protein
MLPGWTLSLKWQRRPAERKAMIDPAHAVPLKRQAELLKRRTKIILQRKLPNLRVERL